MPRLSHHASLAMNIAPLVPYFVFGLIFGLMLLLLALIFTLASELTFVSDYCIEIGKQYQRRLLLGALGRAGYAELFVREIGKRKKRIRY
jgi:hypothetical protein